MGKAKINKVNQKVVTFDEAKRRDFLTGFRKRKNERRQYARNKVAEEVRAERLKERAEKREYIRQNRGFGAAANADDDDEDEGDDDGQEEEDAEAPTAELNSFLTGGMLTTTVVTPMLDEPRPANSLEDARPAAASSAQSAQSNQRPKQKKFNLSVPITQAIPGYQLPSHMKGSKSRKKKKKIKGGASKKDKARQRAPRRES